MSDRAPHPRVDGLVDRSRTKVALDEPGRRATGHPLEIRDPERIAAGEERQGARVTDRGPARERVPGATELALPAVGVCQRVGLARVVGCEAGEGSKPLSFGRSRLDRPGQAGEWAPGGVPPHVIPVEELTHRLPERARLTRRSVVGRRLPDEDEQGPRPGASGVEQVAVSAGGLGTLQSRTARTVEVPSSLVVEKRRGRSPSRQHPLLEPDDEDRLEAARARPRQVEDGDAARFAGGVAPRTVARSSAERTSSARIGTPASRSRSSSPMTSFAASAARRSRFAAARHGRCAKTVGVANHRQHGGTRRLERLVSPPRRGRRSAADDRCAASSSPRPSGRREGRRVRAGVPRESRRPGGGAPRTACGGTRRGHGAYRCSTRTGATRAAPGRMPWPRAWRAPRSTAVRRASRKRSRSTRANARARRRRSRCPPARFPP